MVRPRSAVRRRTPPDSVPPHVDDWARFTRTEPLEPRVLLAAPPATFERVVLSDQVDLRSPAAADWDGDGDIDLLGIDWATSSLKLLAQQPDHTFVLRSVGPNDEPSFGSPMLAADLDGDGHPDLFGVRQVGSTGQFLWQLNDGAGVLKPLQTKVLARIPGVPTTADLDRDGDLDVIVPQNEPYLADNSVAILINDGQGRFGDPVVVGGVGVDTVASLATADLDLDGDIDMAVPSYDWVTRRAILRTLLNDGSGGFTPGAAVWMPPDSLVLHDAAAAADFDDDGDVDLIVATGITINGSNVAILYNDGAGQFPGYADVPAYTAYETIHAADLNGDSLDDVISSPTTTLAWNDGAGGLYRGESLAGGYRLQPPVDVDGDGRRDLIMPAGSAVFFGGGYTDALAPVASRPRFVVSPQAGPPLLAIDCSEPIRAAGSMAGPVLSIRNLTTGEVLDPAGVPVFAEAGDIYTWLLPRMLPDGNYRATLSAAGNTDVAGNPLSRDFSFDFFVLGGDANRDRSVDLADFSILAERFNRPGTFAQGDFDYSGTADIVDFAILGSRFNSSLPPAETEGGTKLAATAAPPPPLRPVNSFGDRAVERVPDLTSTDV